MLSDTFKPNVCSLQHNAISYGNRGGGDDYTMPHDKLVQLSGNRHVQSSRGSLFEHDPNSTANPMVAINPTSNPVVNEYDRKVNAHRN